MYSDEQVPRDVEHYLARARRMRSEYIALLFRRAYVATKAGLRAALRRLRKPKPAHPEMYARR